MKKILLVAGWALAVGCVPGPILCGAQESCEPGYQCTNSGGLEQCVANPAVGRSCGEAGDPDCGPGLICHQPPTPGCVSCVPPPGTCVGEAQQGRHCGGNAANAPECALDLYCRSDNPPDTGGTCEAPTP